MCNTRAHASTGLITAVCWDAASYIAMIQACHVMIRACIRCTDPGAVRACRRSTRVFEGTAPGLDDKRFHHVGKGVRSMCKGAVGLASGRGRQAYT